MTVILLAVLGLLLAAFFSGSETALVSINWIRLEHWIEKGRRGARPLERFVSDPQRLLGTTLVGTNVAIVMTSSLVSWKLSQGLHDWQPGMVALVSTAIVTPVLLVLGEIVPKIIGRRHSDSVTLKVVFPLRFFYWLLGPIIWMTTGLARGVLRLLGVRVTEWRRRLTKEQLRALLTSEGEIAGAVDKEETKLLCGVFEFALTTVGEVMVPRTDIVGIPPGSTVGAAVTLIREHGFSRLPIISEDRDHIEAMIHSRDLLGLPHEQGLDNITRQVSHVPETKTCDELFRELQARRQHMAVVVDEHGSIAGIVTLEDLIEELVGEIEDEYDVKESLIRRIDHDLFMVDGRAEIDDVEEAVGVELPEGDYNTVAGLILKKLGRIPDVGDELVVGGLDLRIISAGQTRIGKVRIRRR
jgi:putative hemolysin